MVAGPRHFLEGDCLCAFFVSPIRKISFRKECSLTKPGYQELAARVAGRYAFPFRAVLRSKNALACTSCRDSQEVCSELRTRPRGVSFC
jgi:hypothetical protein